MFSNLKDVYDKVFVVDAINIDHIVSKLHYRVTVTVLVLFSALLGLQQYAGDPIDCLDNLKNKPDNYVDHYCWVEGTYTKKLPEDVDQKYFENNDHLDCDPKKEECWHHQYYQWVAIVLVCQAGLFYFPRFLWQTWEHGKVKSFVQGLDRSSLVRGLQSEDDMLKNPKLTNLIDIWKKSKGTHDFWAWKFYVCEILFVANIFLQFLFTDFFLQGHFKEVALGNIGGGLHTSVLPITAKCKYSITGKGGDKNVDVPLCILPLNMVNQKFYSFFYFWLSILLVISVIMVTLRVFLVFSKTFRELVINFFYNIKDFNTNLLKQCSHGDWFFITCLIDNMNPLVRSSFLKRLGDEKEFDIDNN